MAAPAFPILVVLSTIRIWPFWPHGKSRPDSSMFVPPNTAQTHRELNGFLRGQFVRGFYRVMWVSKQPTARTSNARSVGFRTMPMSDVICRSLVVPRR